MKINLQVEGMKCDSCKILIEDVIFDLDGVYNVTAVPDKKIVELDFDDQIITIDHIKDEITKLKFKIK